MDTKLNHQYGSDVKTADVNKRHTKRHALQEHLEQQLNNLKNKASYTQKPPRTQDSKQRLPPVALRQYTNDKFTLPAASGEFGQAQGSSTTKLAKFANTS